MKNHRATHNPISHSASLIRKVGRSMDIARSKSISHFAPHSATAEPKKPVTTATSHRNFSDIRPIKRAVVKNEPAKPSISESAKTIKEEAIAAAFQKLSEKQTEKRGIFKRYSKLINIFSIGLVLLAVAGYFIYLNMPSISVRVASAQAGINATYPEYHPDGYSLNGPVSYGDGEVTIKFHANAGESEFIIKQSKSSWDSTAVKDMVDKNSNSEFITTEERGLTVYTYNGNAAWVNGGILYTIIGNAPLSSDQILHIATSL
ncbi:MAG TPA: DUF4367 domain-containing protein [Candidatus Angelobacter sp.]|nr:DUF4367 domain-containing protein [Candidatus Angelobacter sp.]